MARYNSALTSNTITGTATIGSPYSGAFTEFTGTAPYTVTLPTPVAFPGVTQTFYNATSGTVTLSTPTGNFVGTGSSGAGTVPIYSGNVVSIVSDGTNYVVISEDGSPLIATTGSFSGNVTINGGSATLAVTSSVVTMAPTASSTIDNIAIGATTRASGAFTTLTANNAVTLTANTASSSTTTGSLVVTGGIGASGTIYAGAFNGNLTGTLQTAAQPNITSLGTLTGLTVNGSTTITGLTTINTGTGASDSNTLILSRTASTDYHGVTFRTGSTTNWSIGQNTNGPFSIFEAGSATTTRLVVKAGGNVGIGTIDPAKKLHLYDTSVNTSFLIENGTTTNYALMQFKGSGAKTFEIGTGGSGTGIYNGVLYFYDITANSERMRIDSSGNVGIGLTLPTAKLDVAGGVSISGWSNNNSGSAGGMEIGWDGAQSLVQSYNRPGQLFTPLGFTASKHVFNNGNVGIGVTAPLEKLQVAGAIRTTANANNFSGAVGAVFDYYSGSARLAAYDGVYTGQMSLSSGGVLTAPLVTAGGRNVRFQVTLDLSNTSTYLTTTYYPVILPTTPSRTATRYRINSALTGANVPSWSTHPSGFSLLLDWSVNGNGYGTIPVSRVIHSWSESWNTLRIVGGLDQLGNPSYELVYLRGGGIYYLESDGEPFTPIISSTTTTIYGQTCSPTLTPINNVYNAGLGRQGFGTVSASSQPACMLACQSSDIGFDAGSIINYGYSGYTTVFDNYSSYNASNGRYTAPLTGTYFISFTANGRPGNSPGTVPRAYPRINGSYIGGGQIHLRGNSALAANGGDLDQRTMAITLKLTAGDYVDVYVQYGSWDTFGANYFTAYMLG